MWQVAWGWMGWGGNVTVAATGQGAEGKLGVRWGRRQLLRITLVRIVRWDIEWCGVLVTPPPKYHTFP